MKKYVTFLTLAVCGMFALLLLENLPGKTESPAMNHRYVLVAPVGNTQFRDLQAPLCGIFCPYSVDVAPLRRPHSGKISHKLELAAHKKPFSNTL